MVKLWTQASPNARLGAAAAVAIAVIAGVLQVWEVKQTAAAETQAAISAKTEQITAELKALSDKAVFSYDKAAVTEMLVGLRCGFIASSPAHAVELGLEGVDCGALDENARKQLIDWDLPVEFREKSRAVTGPWFAENITLNDATVQQYSALFDDIEACVKGGRCNGADIAASQGQTIIDFVNRVCNSVDSPHISRPQLERMASFVVTAGVSFETHNDDISRENTFHCDFLRVIAQADKSSSPMSSGVKTGPDVTVQNGA